MKDIPVFATQYGVASLILEQIPYRQEAYVRIRASQDPGKLLEECVSFCRMCGAERIFAAGDSCLEAYPRHTAVVKLCIPVKNLPPAEAEALPVRPEELEHWRSLYNQKMRPVPNAAWLTEGEGKRMLEQRSGYWIRKDDSVIGMGRAAGDRLDAVVALVPGAGQDVVCAMAGVLTEEIACLEVADANSRAMKLYRRLGFTQSDVLSVWYKIL